MNVGPRPFLVRFIFVLRRKLMAQCRPDMQNGLARFLHTIFRVVVYGLIDTLGESYGEVGK